MPNGLLKRWQSCIVRDARGNHKAEGEAKFTASKVATEPMALTAALFPSPLVKWDPSYS